MTQGADAAPETVAIDELRFLGDTLRRVDTAAAAAEWDDVSALAGVVAEAQAELTSLRGAAGYDISAAGASPAWLARADDFAGGVAAT
ncbi:MAG TPA: ABC transporter permease, partial [Mycobacterium sp.]